MVIITHIDTDSGVLAGESLEGRSVRRFRGVSYAAAPVGELRWRAPQPVQPWTGTRKALEFGPSSLQAPPPDSSLYSGGERDFSEDCLNLNVWTGAPGDTGRPVLVWLHFGAYQFGSASNPIYDGEALAEAGVTVVSVNSRLGRLGFLAHPELSKESGVGASGNYGLMDQIAALQWVQNNIAAFGGDVTNVTLAGVSAGANSVHLLRAAPAAKGLFHKAIALSGPGVSKTLDGFGHPANAQTLAAGEQAGVEIAALVGATSVAELRALPVERLLEPQLPRTAGEWSFDLVPGAKVSMHIFDGGYPVVDGHVLPQSALDAYARGEVHDIPMIVGNTGNEASGLPYIATLAEYESYLDDTFGSDADEARALYPASDDAAAQRSSWELIADAVFVHSTWTAARLHQARLESPVWHHRFLRVPPIPSTADVIEREYAGAFHSADVLYGFGTFRSKDWGWTPADAELSDLVQASWLSFLRRGEPTDGGRIDWPRFENGRPTSKIWDAPERVGDVSQPERMAFWDRWNGVEVPL